jgi:vitamin B12 transporter
VPTLYQRFSEYGVSTLRPETSQNVELGMNYAQADTTAGIVVYRNRVRNLINFVGTATGCASSFGCYTNVNRATLQGATLSASQRFGDVTLRASFDVQDPKDTATGNLLARRAKRHGVVGADWRVAGWTLGAEVQASSQRYDDAANTVKLGGYTLLNLSASTKITRDLNLVARVDNVGNKDYQFARLYANAGRTAYVGLKWTPQ